MKYRMMKHGFLLLIVTFGVAVAQQSVQSDGGRDDEPQYKRDEPETSWETYKKSGFKVPTEGYPGFLDFSCSNKHPVVKNGEKITDGCSSLNVTLINQGNGTFNGDLKLTLHAADTCGSKLSLHQSMELSEKTVTINNMQFGESRLVDMTFTSTLNNLPCGPACIYASINDTSLSGYGSFRWSKPIMIFVKCDTSANGKIQLSITPNQPIDVRPGKNFTMELARNGYYDFEINVTTDSGQSLPRPSRLSQYCVSFYLRESYGAQPCSTNRTRDARQRLDDLELGTLCTDREISPSAPFRIPRRKLYDFIFPNKTFCSKGELISVFDDNYLTNDSKRDDNVACLPLYVNCSGVDSNHHFESKDTCKVLPDPMSLGKAAWLIYKPQKRPGETPHINIFKYKGYPADKWEPSHNNKSDMAMQVGIPRILKLLRSYKELAEDNPDVCSGLDENEDYDDREFNDLTPLEQIMKSLTRTFTSRARSDVPCNSDCQNGGTCTNNGTCTCSNKWSGPRCSERRVNCTVDGCENGGSCMFNGSCYCFQGTRGRRCAERDDIDSSTTQGGDSGEDKSLASTIAKLVHFVRQNNKSALSHWVKGNRSLDHLDHCIHRVFDVIKNMTITQNNTQLDAGDRYKELLKLMYMKRSDRKDSCILYEQTDILDECLQKLLRLAEFDNSRERSDRLDSNGHWRGICAQKLFYRAVKAGLLRNSMQDLREILRVNFGDKFRFDDGGHNGTNNTNGNNTNIFGKVLGELGYNFTNAGQKCDPLAIWGKHEYYWRMDGNVIRVGRSTIGGDNKYEWKPTGVCTCDSCNYYSSYSYNSYSYNSYSYNSYSYGYSSGSYGYSSGSYGYSSGSYGNSSGGSYSSSYSG